MSRLVMGPFNRVEGDLEVTLDIADGMVRSAQVNAPLYRGFEQILVKRPIADAMVIAPRICGICSVSQSVAAARAIAGLEDDIQAPPNGRLAADLVLGAENLADHLTHFYAFFMPDFARENYAGRPWYDHAHFRFKAMTGSAANDAMPARARLLHIMGLLAGKWPHSLALQPGGTTKAVDAGERIRLLGILAETRSFLEGTMFGGALEDFAALSSLAELDSWVDRSHLGDARFFLRLSRDLGLDEMGRAFDRFMSFGAFKGSGGDLFSRGIWHQGQVMPVPLTDILEDLSHAWMDGEARHPAEGVTRPLIDKQDAYSWCKAPRLGGHPVEVGALARQMVNQHPLLRDLVETKGGSVLARVLARLVEMALLVPAMEDWAKAIKPREPFHLPHAEPVSGLAAGLVEAARGSLGHWLSAEYGRITSYQIIAPTTWNFSPRDAKGLPGPLEKALENTPAPPTETTPITAQHIIRSFDPCMACTVH